MEAKVNKLILRLKSKYVKDFEFMLKAAALNPGSEVNPADYVQIVGEVVSVPKKISGGYDYKGVTAENISVGDTVFFSYLVVYDFDETPDGVKFRNQILFRGKEYWLADITQIFAVIKDGEIMPINGNVILSEPPPPTLIVHQAIRKKMINAEALTVYYAEPRFGLEKGQTVAVNPRSLQKYRLNDKKFAIAKYSAVLGVINE